MKLSIRRYLLRLFLLCAAVAFLTCLPFGGGRAAFAQNLAIANAHNYGPEVTPDSYAVAFSDAQITSQTIGIYPFPPLPELGGVTARLVGGFTLGLVYVSPYQVNLYIPANTPAGVHGVTITGPGGTFNGTVRIVTNAPHLFTRPGTDIAAGFYLNIGVLLASFPGTGSAVRIDVYTGQQTGTASLVLDDGRQFAAIAAGPATPPEYNQRFAFILPTDIFNGSPRARLRVCPDAGICVDSNVVTIQR